MAVGLAGTAVFAAVEEDEQLFRLFAFCWEVMVRAYASICSREILGVKEVCLWFECARDEDRVFGYDGELIEDQDVVWLDGSDC